jgi:hypothetical protein
MERTVRGPSNACTANECRLHFPAGTKHNTFNQGHYTRHSARPPPPPLSGGSSGPYSATVMLPNTPFSLRANSAVREVEIQKWWEDQAVYKTLSQGNSGVSVCVCVDGWVGGVAHVCVCMCACVCMCVCVRGTADPNWRKHTPSHTHAISGTVRSFAAQAVHALCVCVRMWKVPV